jgi:ferredoxin
MDEPKRKVHKIVVDRKLCIGAATCIVVAPKAFELDAEGIAIVKPGAKELDDEMLIQAAQSCPTQAIFLYDADGKKLN